MKLSRLKNRSGIVLMIVLWILVILSLLAIGLGRSNNVELSLTKHAISSLKAKYIAWAGLIYVINHIRVDSIDKTWGPIDTQYNCGIRLNSSATLESLFKDQKIGEGHFDVRFRKETEGSAQAGTTIGETYTKNVDQVLNLTKNTDQKFWKEYYGFKDEERKININGLQPQNINILNYLITILGFDTTTAQTVSASILDWKDSDPTPISSAGAEDDYYTSLPKGYKCKNTYFDSLEELFLVRGMTKELYEALKPHITIFPKQEAFHINFDTAHVEVLRALAQSFTGAATNTDISDADSLADKMITYRRGDDREDMTRDDRQINVNDMGLNAREQALFLVMNQYNVDRSDYLDVEVKGVEESRNVKSIIRAIIKRDDLSIVYWHRQ